MAGSAPEVVLDPAEPTTPAWHRPPQRPWCFPCRALTGERCWAEHLGVACDWHFGILSPADQAALRAAVRARHPRGGRVRMVLDQIWIVRHDLRDGTNTVERTWIREANEYLADLAAADAADLAEFAAQQAAADAAELVAFTAQPAAERD